MPSIGTNSKPAYVYDAGTDTWIPIGPGEHTHDYIGKDVITTTGDLLYGTAADTVTRLGIGTAGQVLQVNSGATAPEWALGVNLQLNAQTATYTVVLGDAFKLVTMSNAAANDFQIPTNANVAFPVGTVINVVQIGAGTTTIEAVTPGTTTVESTGATTAAPELRAQFSAASCIKVATDTWYVVGDIA
jgi:hypothetical protein